MAVKEPDPPWWVWPLLVLGGTATAAVLIDAMTGPKKYRCHNCNTLVAANTPACPNCHATFRWGVGTT